MPGTDPDAVEAWCFDPNLLEALLKRLVPYSPVLLLSGDVHYATTNAMSYWYKKTKQDKEFVKEPARIVQFISSGLKNVMKEIFIANRGFSVLQKMIRAKIGAERLGWENNSPATMKVPDDSAISPRLRARLSKSPVLIPTIGWRGATTARKSDWAWRVTPIRDTREDKDRPKMARPVSLFPDRSVETDNDITKTDFEGYHRAAERHARQLDRLNNCRQILFISNIGLIRFEKRTEKDDQERTSM